MFLIAISLSLKWWKSVTVCNIEANKLGITNKSILYQLITAGICSGLYGCELTFI